MQELRYHQEAETSPLNEISSEPWQRFSHRQRTHITPLTENTISGMDLTREFKSILSLASPKIDKALYVHIPFCRCICTFCGLARIRSADEQEVHEYVEALIRHFRLMSDYPYTKSGKYQAVYLGGGTPSLLSVTQLRKITQTIRNSFPLSDDIEWTLEGRFMDFDDEKIAVLLENGVNRISLGVQTFHNEHRRKMGRIVSGDEAFARLSRMKQMGVSCLSVDLIYNLPGQSLTDFSNDLDRLINSPIDGVSIYPLSVQKNSTLHEQICSGWTHLGDLEHEYRLFMLAEEYLSKAGFSPAGTTHWVRDRRDRNIYNRFATEPDDLLAIGCFAGGVIGNLRYINYPSVPVYIQRIRMGSVEPMFGQVRRELLSPFAKNLHELIFCGWSNFSTKASEGDQNLAVLLETFIHHGFIDWQNQAMIMTPLGRFWANNLAILLNRQMICELPSGGSR
jgi:oxygen-independent coproporphyrinogen-3 oxidase